MSAGPSVYLHYLSFKKATTATTTAHMNAFVILFYYFNLLAVITAEVHQCSEYTI